MRKFLIATIVLCLLLSLAGCSGGTTTTTAAAAPVETTAAPQETTASAATDPAKTDGAQETTAPPAPSVDYPKGDINFLIPNAAGGGNDLTTRALIPSLQATFNANVVPLNKGESKGAVAANELAKAKADGQTLYFNSQSLILLTHSGVDTVKLEDFQPVAQVVEDTGVIYVNADSEYKTIEDFIEKAKTKTMKVGSNGQGALWHLAAIQLQNATDLKFQVIPYATGGAPMVTSLASGETDMCIVNPSEGKAMVEAGKIRPIAVMSEERLNVFKDVPTLKESGVDLVFPVWRGVFTTKGTSEEILNELDKAFTQAVQSEDFVKYCETSSLPIKYRDHKAFTEFFNAQVELYNELMQSIK